MSANSRAAAEALGARISGDVPEVMLVLGSGLGALADAVEDPVVVPFEELPGFPAAGVAGHAGHWVAGRLEGRSVLVQQGRYHLYEGHAPETVVLPVRTARALGVERLVVTNAAGGIRRDLGPGSIVLLDDHINLQFRNPLTGGVHQGEIRFPDMSAPYDTAWMNEVEALALRLRVPLARGVYVAVTGPSYETPAEVRMLGRLGADVVGMSTVPEVIAARASGMRCLGFSLVTNAAAGLGAGTLDHAEVVEVGRQAGATLERLLRGVLAELDGGSAQRAETK
ncbi:MAG: purine-nucleoside phosphorylase [Gemmatimonadetes bacterium]|nr:purine-nucleoside phosphorylase [Gemmatimonadota bacterium]